MKTTTSINRGWLIKTSIYFLAMIGLGVWGLVDGLVVYPKRGHNAAEFLEKQYLAQAEKAGALSKAPVETPAEELIRLKLAAPDLRKEIEKAGDAGTFAMAEKQMMLDRHEWLIALSRVGWLTPDRTRMLVDDAGKKASDPSRRLRELETKWASKTPPKPLGAFDIPAQWLIAAAGLGAGAWILGLTALVASKKYRWDPDRLAITLPGGKTIEPKDIKEIDKRKWDKYLVFLHLKDGSPEIRLDLLRYTPLEEWVLEMERQTDGYEGGSSAADGVPIPASDQNAENAPTA